MKSLDALGRLGAVVPWWREDMFGLARELVRNPSQSAPGWVFDEARAPNDEDLRLFVAAYKEAFLLAASVEHRVHVMAYVYRYRTQATVAVTSLTFDGETVESGGLVSWVKGSGAAHGINVSLLYDHGDPDIGRLAQVDLMGWGKPVMRKMPTAQYVDDTRALEDEIVSDRFTYYLGWSCKLPRRRARR